MSGGACSGDYINATEVDHLGALSLLRIIMIQYTHVFVWVWYIVHGTIYLWVYNWREIDKVQFRHVAYTLVLIIIIMLLFMNLYNNCIIMSAIHLTGISLLQLLISSSFHL